MRSSNVLGVSNDEGTRNVMRIKRCEADREGRKVADLERIIREFDQMAADLDRQIQLEEDRSGIRDRGHFSYSTFAKAAAQRRDNLRDVD